jgi:hypothetical protein
VIYESGREQLRTGSVAMGLSSGLASVWATSHFARGFIVLVMSVLAFSVSHTRAEQPPAPEHSQVQCAGTLTWDEIVLLDRAQPVPPGETPLPRGSAPQPRSISDVHISAIPSTPLPGLGPRSCIGLASPTLLSPTFIGLDDNGTRIPPDTMGAVGPDHVMTTLNTDVRITDRAGNQQSRVSLASFCAAIGGNNFDPFVHFDPLSQRWFLLTCVDSRSAASSIGLSVSRTSDPRGTWDFYRIDADTSNLNWVDFARMGMNDTWVAVTGNMYSVSGSSWRGNKMWVFSKASTLSNGGPLLLTTFDTGFDLAGSFTGFTLQPARSMEPSPDVLHIVDCGGLTTSSESGSTVLLRLSQITGTAEAPTWSVVPGSIVDGTGLFPVNNNYDLNVPGMIQQGSTTRIDGGDYRMQSVTYRNGKLWCVHTGGQPVGSPNRSAVIWYQLNTTLPNAIIQQGSIEVGPGSASTFPSIAVNCADDVLIGFTRSSNIEFASAACAWRFASNPPGLMARVEIFRSGLAPYVKTFGGTRNRWGDYSATVVDPANDSAFWTLQQFAALPVDGTDRWGVAWARVGGCVAPTILTQPISTSICQGVNVTLSVNVNASTSIPITYQWRRGTTELSNGGQYSNVTTRAMTITGYSTTDSGKYNCVVSNGCGSVASADAVLFTLPDSIVPTGLVASDSTSCNEVVLNWDPTPGATSYLVYRGATDNPTNATAISAPTANTFVDQTATPGTVSWYWVKAAAVCGESEFSASDRGSRAGAPLIPTGLAASDSTDCAAVNVTWNPGVNATSYRLFRNTVNNIVTATLIGTPTTNAFIDSSALPGTLYYYWVGGSSPCGNGGISPTNQGTRARTLTITTQPAPSQTLSLGTVARFTVTVTGSGPVSYQWFKESAPLSNGGQISGANSPNLFVGSLSLANAGSYICKVTGVCGSVTTNPAILNVVGCPCAADFDASGGTPDTADIDAFFIAWLAGNTNADADCSAGTPDTGDIDLFFTQWLAGGCP